MTQDNQENNQGSPIKSGWRGNQNGFIENTKSHIEVSEITLRLDKETAYALCNILTDRTIDASHCCEAEQVVALKTLGAAIGRTIDHHSANNQGRKIIK